MCTHTVKSVWVSSSRCIPALPFHNMLVPTLSYLVIYLVNFVNLSTYLLTYLQSPFTFFFNLSLSQQNYESGIIWHFFCQSHKLFSTFSTPILFNIILRLRTLWKSSYVYSLLHFLCHLIFSWLVLQTGSHQFYLNTKYYIPLTHAWHSYLSFRNQTS